ncbi:MAG: amidohydrolase family protein [Vicinamibacterales bacterium]
MTRTVLVFAVALVLGGVLIARQAPTPAQNPAGRGDAAAPADGRVPDAATPQIGRGGRGGRGRAVSIAPGEECPAGMTLVRVNTCQPPDFPPPSIVDYRPKSSLVVEQHPVPRAKFPVVDIHSHVTPTAESIGQLVREMDALNLRVLVINSASGQRLKDLLQVIRTAGYADRFRVMASVDFNNVGPGWAMKAVAQLEADVQAGAVGIGEIGKQLGLTLRKADGSRLQIDDPDLVPLWNAMARLRLPVFIHTADPGEFFKPLDYTNERWLELALFGDRRWFQQPIPLEMLNAERDNLFKNNPRTRFIMAHLGWHANDLGRLGRLLDAYPNVVTEMGAVLYDLGRQPRAAHDFFVKYQDRLLFGKDAYAPAEYPYYWRVFQTKDEYFDYYRDYHAYWKLYGLDLPDAVLRKIYFQNALSVTPGLPRNSWP